MTSLAALVPLAGETAALAEMARRSVVVVYSRHGHGSGVVWDRQGLVVTNHHVAPGERADVELDDGRRLSASVIARDERNDLALLRLGAQGVSLTGLTAPPVGDSKTLQVGELILAVGHPRGVRGATTLGIVSALGSRTWRGHARRELLQADIDLAPGSSGGPLVNAAGEVVGIASMVMSPGIALAIPSHLVMRFVAQAARPARERLAA